jgi:hypothetical protein
MRKLIAVLLIVLAGFLLWRFVWSKQTRLEDTRVQATVKEQVLSSPRFPALKLQFAPEFKYAGGHRFQLGTADAEQHYWIEADDKKQIKRMFWIQFRDARYNPDTEYEIDLWGYHWDCAKNMQGPPEEESDPEADHARMRAYLRSKGYSWPKGWLRLRMITSDVKEKEQIMVWFMEDATLLVTSALDLNRLQGGDKEEIARSAYVRQDPANPNRWLDWNSEERVMQRVKIAH